jgi:hypothetical protein
MTTPNRSGPKVKAERPDPEDAARNPGFGSQDRPGFDLGGAKDKSGTGSNVLPRGPRRNAPAARRRIGRGRQGGRLKPPRVRQRTNSLPNHPISR